LPSLPLLVSGYSDRLVIKEFPPLPENDVIRYLTSKIGFPKEKAEHTVALLGTHLGHIRKAVSSFQKQQNPSGKNLLFEI
jgi:hypothetical protein